MSAWPEAIYTIKKITADLLTKYNNTISSITAVNSNITSLSGAMGSFSNQTFSSMTSILSDIATVNGAINTLNGNITNMNGNMLLKQYTIASSTAGLTSNGFVSGAICFINEG